MKKTTIIKAIITFVLFYLRQYMQIIPIYLFHIDVNHPTNMDLAIVNLTCNLLLVILLFLLYRKELITEFKKFKQNFREYIDTGLRYWLIGLAIMITTNLLITIVTPMTNSSNETVVQQLIDISPFMMFITAGILAPIVEEMTFRKAIRAFFKNKWIYCLVSGLIFGLLHVIGSTNWQEYLYVISYGGLGFAFAYAYYETDNIFTPISVHMLHNSLLILLSVI